MPLPLHQRKSKDGGGRVMKATPAICGDHLVPISECDCLSYMREITRSAERLIELAKEREAMR